MNIWILDLNNINSKHHFSLNLSITISYMVKSALNCRNENLHKGKQGKVVFLSAPTPLSKTYVHPLCALHSSHQIKFLLCSALVLYLQNVLLEQHKHVTMRTLKSFTQTETSFLVKSFAFLLLPLMPVLGLIKRLSYLLVCFSPM